MGTLLRWFILGIKSPSKETAKVAKKHIIKPMQKGMKQMHQLIRAEEKACRKFKKQWLKKNKDWKDCRHKKRCLQREIEKRFKYIAQRNKFRRFFNIEG